LVHGKRRMGEVSKKEDAVWLGASGITTRSGTASGSSNTEKVDTPSQAPFVIVVAKPHDHWRVGAISLTDATRQLFCFASLPPATLARKTHRRKTKDERAARLSAEPVPRFSRQYQSRRMKRARIRAQKRLIKRNRPLLIFCKFFLFF
jgi:hypothetical protein